MADGNAAYSMMRSFSLGISDADLAKISSVADTSAMKSSSSACSSNALAARLKGNILLQTQQHGEAWYVDPSKCRSIYMKDGDAAYTIMRYLGLGITDADLGKIPAGSSSQNAAPSPQSSGSQPSFGDGIHIVGTDIVPGTYRNSGTGFCYYARLSGFSGQLKDIIANANTSSQSVVTIDPSDKGFQSSGCGTWMQISAAPAQQPSADSQSSPQSQSSSVSVDGLSAIRISGGIWDNWDSDIENDGPVIEIVYLDANGEIIGNDATEKMPISADVKVYAGSDSISSKTKLVFSSHYDSNQIILGGIYPKIRIPKENINVNSATDYKYGAVEVTIQTPVQGAFAAKSDFIELYE
jgi:hypothetical protein